MFLIKVVSFFFNILQRLLYSDFQLKCNFVKKTSVFFLNQRSNFLLVSRQTDFGIEKKLIYSAESE